MCYIIPLLVADTSLSGDVNFSPKTIQTSGRQAWKRAHPFRWCKLSRILPTGCCCYKSQHACAQSHTNTALSKQLEEVTAAWQDTRLKCEQIRSEMEWFWTWKEKEEYMNHPFYIVYYTLYGSKKHLCDTPPQRVNFKYVLSRWFSDM